MNRLDKKQIFIGTILGIILSILTLILLTRNIQPLSAQQTQQKYTVFKTENQGFIFKANSGLLYGDLITILSNGNIGIGTKNPEGKLDIRRRMYSWAGDYRGWLEPRCRCDNNTSYIDCVDPFNTIDPVGNVCYDQYRWEGTNYSRKFIVSETPLMFINATGTVNNIGIGLTNPHPQVKLDVNGVIRSHIFVPSDEIINIAPATRTFSGITCGETNRIKVFSAPGPGRYKVTFDIRGGHVTDYCWVYLKCDGVPCSPPPPPLLSRNPRSMCNTSWSTQSVEMDRNPIIYAGEEIEVVIYAAEWVPGPTIDCMGSQYIQIKNVKLQGSAITPPAPGGVIVD